MYIYKSGLFGMGNWYLFLSVPHFLEATSRQLPRIVTSSGHTLFLLNLGCCGLKGLKSLQYHSFCQLSILFYYRLLNHGSSNFLWQRVTPVVVSWCANRKWKKIKIKIISGRTIPSRQNYRVISQSVHNLQAWPRAAWVGASSSKRLLPALFASCTLSCSNLSCAQCHSVVSDWVKEQDLRNFRPLRPPSVDIQLVFLLPKHLSPGLRHCFCSNSPMLDLSNKQHYFTYILYKFC
jgi:hypothetical protein